MTSILNRAREEIPPVKLTDKRRKAIVKDAKRTLLDLERQHRAGFDSLTRFADDRERYAFILELADRCEALEKLLAEACEIGLTAENPRSTREECVAFYERLFAIRQEAGGNDE
jgi:hypothetical protein